jgi:hypothetical protein
MVEWMSKEQRTLFDRELAAPVPTSRPSRGAQSSGTTDLMRAFGMAGKR